MGRNDRFVRLSPVLLALAAITAGAYFPWARANPEFDQIPAIGFSRLNAGIEIYSLLLLLGVSLVLLAVIRGDDNRLQSLSTIVVGVSSILLLVNYLYSFSYVGFDATFVPTYGWYLVLIGAIALICSGCIQLAHPKIRAE